MWAATRTLLPHMDTWLVEVFDLIGRLMVRLSARAMRIGLVAIMAFVASLAVVRVR